MFPLNFRADWGTDFEKYVEEEVLIVAYEDEETAGGTFAVCITPAAKNELFALVKKREAEEAAKKKAKEDEIAAKKAAEEAIAFAVYEDKPIIAKPWVSESTVDTEGEISLLEVISTRPKLALSIEMKYGDLMRRRTDPSTRAKFSDRRADQTGYVEARQQKDPAYPPDGLVHCCLDRAFQTAPTSQENSAQTTWNRPLNKGSQSAAIEKTAAEQRADITNPTLLAFLRRAESEMTLALQQNETMNLFTDDFNDIGEEENSIGKQTQEIRTLKTFADIQYSKNKSAAFVDWHPTKRDTVAVAVVASSQPTAQGARFQSPFDQRAQTSGVVSLSHLLLWSFLDPLRPQITLETPHDAYCFRFNPTAPHLIAAGCESGQVCIWDVTEAEAALEKKKQQQLKHHDEDEEDADRNAQIPPVQPMVISDIDSSHRRPVEDIVWLPAGMEVNYLGNYEVTNARRSYQFLTVATDGQVCIWDTRYADIAKGVQVFIANKKMHKEIKKNKDGTMPAIPWHAHYKLTLTKLEGVGELGLRHACLLCTSNNNTSKANAVGTKTGEALGESFSSQFYCGTEDGEMVFAEWAPSTEDADTEKKDGENAEVPKEGGSVSWMARDHARPCTSLDRSPFFPELMLSVSDWSFNLWQAELQTPLFSSPLTPAQLTCGRWSPTRAGLLVVAKADGFIDFWDFTDQSHKPSISLRVVSCAITSMEFMKTSGNSHTKQQLLAVGDANGNLHILEIPRNLSRPVAHEETLVRDFFAREHQHVLYVERRQKVRAAELVAKTAAAEAEGEAEEEVGDDELQAAAVEEETQYDAMEEQFKKLFASEGEAGVAGGGE
jgi:WD40 repeat protein